MIAEKKALDLAWWYKLETQWKNAFAKVFFGHSNEPTQEELQNLFDAPAMRFAGPAAPYPNLQFELTNLSGLAELQNLEILVLIHHQIEEIDELKELRRLKNLFLYGNKIRSIEPLEDLLKLEQMYLQDNQIQSIVPLRKLTNLKELYVNGNSISSLNGLTEEHAEKLEIFFCKPNDNLKRAEMMRIERELAIKCREL